MQEIARRQPGGLGPPLSRPGPAPSAPGGDAGGGGAHLERDSPLPAGGVDPAEPLHDGEPLPRLLVDREDAGRPLRRGGAAHRRRGHPRHARRAHRPPHEHAERVRRRSSTASPTRCRSGSRRRCSPTAGRSQTVPAGGLAGGLPVPGLRRPAARALQRPAARRGRALLRRACRSRPARRRSRRSCSSSRSRPAERWQAVAMLALVVVLAFLMVSTFRYRSFKGVDLRRRRSYISVLGIALLFLLVATQPEASLLAVTSLYTVSGPLAWAVRRPAPPRRAAAGPVGGAAARAVSPAAPVVGVGGVVVRDGRVAAHPAGQAAALRPLGGPRRHRRARGDAGGGPRARDGGGDGPARRADRGADGLRPHRARGRAGRRTTT